LKLLYNCHHSKNSALPPPTIFLITVLGAAFTDTLGEAFVDALGTAFADVLGTAFADALGTAFTDVLGTAFADALGAAFADVLHFESFDDSFNMAAISILILLSSFIMLINGYQSL
jgi:uncharacterized membrane protein YjjP (DUF1212 family)